MLIVALLVAQAAAPVSKIPDMKPVAGIPSLLESGMPEVPPQLRARIEQYRTRARRTRSTSSRTAASC